MLHNNIVGGVGGRRGSEPPSKPMSGATGSVKTLCLFTPYVTKHAKGWALGCILGWIVQGTSWVHPGPDPGVGPGVSPWLSPGMRFCAVVGLGSGAETIPSKYELTFPSAAFARERRELLVTFSYSQLGKR